MNHKLLLEYMHLLFEFEKETEGGLLPSYTQTIDGFKKWIREKQEEPVAGDRVDDCNEKITTEQHITLSLFKIANYSKLYWRALLVEGAFVTQENWIILLNLWIHGAMTKMDLIRRSGQEKPTGMQIINRLIEQKFVQQKDSEIDKRSKIIEITALGQHELWLQMDDLQRVSQIITGDFPTRDKQHLRFLLQRLLNFHEEVFKEYKGKVDLLDLVVDHKLK